jgi:uncharacterized protein (DUF1330 family)
MTVYVIADIEITDQDAYAEYQKLVPPIIEKFGGKYLVRGGQIISGESEWGLTRIVMLEFPSAEKAEEYATSDEYAPIAAIRHKSATSRSFMVEGIDSSTDAPLGQ